MTAQLIDGKKIAADIREELKANVAQLQKDFGVTPGLAVILVGEDPASQSYVTAKERACQEIGIYSDDNRIPASTTQEELLALIAEKNADPRIHGILVQLPLPKHISEQKIIEAIDPAKDVDGFHPVNLGKMVAGRLFCIGHAYGDCGPHQEIQYRDSRQALRDNRPQQHRGPPA